MRRAAGVLITGALAAGALGAALPASAGQLLAESCSGRKWSLR
jgi:hypothetical protein